MEIAYFLDSMFCNSVGANMSSLHLYNTYIASFCSFVRL